MKGKVVISIIAAILIIVAVVMIINEVGSDGDWTLALVFIGLLVGILAVIINVGSKSNNNEDIGTAKEVEQDEKLRTLKNLRESGVLTEEEYLSKVHTRNSEIADERWTNGEFFDLLVNILKARESDMITQEEFLEKCKQIVKDNGKIVADEQIGKLKELYDNGIVIEKEFNKNVVKRYLFELCFDEETISVLLNGDTPIFTTPQIKYLSHYKYLTNLDRGNMEDYLQRYKDKEITKEQYQKKMRKMASTLDILRHNITEGKY